MQGVYGAEEYARDPFCAVCERGRRVSVGQRPRDGAALRHGKLARWRQNFSSHADTEALIIFAGFTARLNGGPWLIPSLTLSFSVACLAVDKACELRGVAGALHLNASNCTLNLRKIAGAQLHG